MTDERERVRALYDEAEREACFPNGSGLRDRMIDALAKRLQPKPTCLKCGGADRVIRDADGVTVVYHNCHPKPEKPKESAPVSLRDDAKWLAERIGGPNEGWGAWEDWLRSVVQRHASTVASEKPKKVWSVSHDTVHAFRKRLGVVNLPTHHSLNSVAADIIRERPDLVAEEYQRRYRAAFGVEASLKNLFPELDPK